MSIEAAPIENDNERYLTAEDGVKIWRQDGYSYVATPLPDDELYRKVVRTGNNDIERVWKKARVKIHTEDDVEKISIERRRITGKHEVLIGAAVAAVGAAVAIGVHEYRKHKND